MKIKFGKMFIIVIFIRFYFILNEPIPIQNFEMASFPQGTTEYYYQFSEPTLQDGKDAYFFFKFSYDFRITFTIIDEEDKKNLININSNRFYCKYKIENLKPQKFIFIIKNDNWCSYSMIFIDNSREINTDFENLLTLNFDTETIEDKPPLPLIFNLDLLEEKLIIIFDESYDSDNIYDGKSRLEYCEIDENECNFKSNGTNLILEKGKKYKVKYNCQNESSTYSFSSYKILSLIREVDLGYHGFTLDNNLEEFYFILDVKSYKNLYIYTYQIDNHFYCIYK